MDFYDCYLKNNSEQILFIFDISVTFFKKMIKVIKKRQKEFKSARHQNNVNAAASQLVLIGCILGLLSAVAYNRFD